MWEAEFVGGPLDGAVRAFQGSPPRLLIASVVVQLPDLKPEATAYVTVGPGIEVAPEPGWVRYRLEVCMDPERPAWRLVLER